MHDEIIIAGFGGQGVLFAGTLLAQAAVEEDKHTTWFPSYGAEMRGGTANSTVIVSDDEIGSPVVPRPSVLIALNEASLEKFLPRVQDGGLVVVNSSLVRTPVKRTDVRVVTVPATELADQKLGNVRTANLVSVGAYLAAAQGLKLESAQAACAQVLAEKPKMIDINRKALELGYASASSRS